MIVLFKCVLCKNDIKKLYQKNQERPPFLNCACGGIMEAQLPDFETSSYEVVDNGNQAKKVLLRKDQVAKGKQKGDIYKDLVETRDGVVKRTDDGKA